MWSLDRVAKLYYLIMECENARLKKGISFRLRSPFAVLKVGVHLRAVFTSYKIGQMCLSLLCETHFSLDMHEAQPRFGAKLVFVL